MYSQVQFTDAKVTFRCTSALGAVLSLLVSLLLLSEGCFSAEPPRPLIMAYLEFPPFFYTDEQGKASGDFLERIISIANTAGYRVKPISMPAARLYHSVKQGSLDLWVGALKMPSMKEHAYMLPIPEAHITLKLWYMEGTSPVTRIEEIKGGTLVVINGYVYGGLLKRLPTSELNLHTVKNWDHKAALHVLSSGRASYLLDYAEPIGMVLKQEPIPGLRNSTLGTSLLALIIPKRSSLAEPLKAVYSRAFDLGEMDDHQ